MKYTKEQIERAAKKASKAFRKWNTQPGHPDSLRLELEKDRAVIRLLEKMGFPVWEQIK